MPATITDRILSAIGVLILIIAIIMGVKSCGTTTPATEVKVGCATFEPCSATEQFIDLKAFERGKKAAFEDAQKEAGDIANFTLATERLADARAERDKLEKKVETLEFRINSSGSSNRSGEIAGPPRDNCDFLSERKRIICQRAR
jgi:hypothetical protein